MADLNYDNSQMRQAMIESMEYWIKEAGVDGFRCDVADQVPADFWKEAIDSLKACAGRPILMLAEGADPATFEAGFNSTMPGLISGPFATSLPTTVPRCS